LLKLRIIVADDNPAMLQEVVSVLRSEFDVVATAMDGAAARECIERYHPDVAVLDVAMPHVNGIELTKELARNGNSIRVILCSVETDQDTIDAAFQAGAAGYVLKVQMVRDLIPAIKSVVAGRQFKSHEP
jgi:DNA-binding NarL/FixJ family response regulator